MTDGASRDEVDGCFKRVMPSPVWNQQGIAHNPSVLGQILSE
jgi:hypothetical protein